MFWRLPDASSSGGRHAGRMAFVSVVVRVVQCPVICVGSENAAAAGGAQDLIDDALMQQEGDTFIHGAVIVRCRG